MRKSKDRNVIGSQVRRFRYKRGLTQEELTVKCQLAGFDITRDTLAQIESQFRQVTDKEVLKFARVLKTTVAELYPKRK